VSSNFFFTVWCSIKQRHSLNFLFEIFIWNELSPTVAKIRKYASRNQPQANPQCNLPPMFLRSSAVLLLSRLYRNTLRRSSPSMVTITYHRCPMINFFFISLVSLLRHRVSVFLLSPRPFLMLRPFRLNTDFHSFPITCSQA